MEPMEIVRTKPCKICLEDKPLSEFPKKSVKKRKSYCRTCSSNKESFIVINGIRFPNLSNTDILVQEAPIIIKRIDGSAQIVTNEIAMKYVNEGRAIIVDAVRIQEKYSTDQFHHHIMQRDRFICQLCQSTEATFVIRRSTLGLSYQAECISVCKPCQVQHAINRNSRNSDRKVIQINDEMDGVYFIKDAKGKYLREVKGKEHLHIYCDCSNFQTGSYGIGLVLVGGGQIEAKTQLVHSTIARYSIYGELAAIKKALGVMFEHSSVINFKAFRKITIYSDLIHIHDILYHSYRYPIVSEFVNEIHEIISFVRVLYPRTIISIRYLEDKKNGFYKVSHKLSRRWIGCKKVAGFEASRND
ncbi:hypothetical protein [Paenibacillus sp. WC2504]|uniref:hypothetical protein n=1 Tax=Paenibacillus sp. WC2504 TaxID=3461403 RepID=UPI00404664E4